MNDICLRHGVKVVSDEIHCELIMPGHKFQPFAAVSQECRNNCVVLNSPSKSFNIAGLQTANIVCTVPEWRRRIDRAININEVCDLNSFGPPALIAAYNESEYWIDQLNPYLWQNYQAVCQFFAKEIPQLVVCDLEGTYLLWVDVSALLGGDGGFGNVEKLCNHLQNEGRVWVNPGTMYGPATGRNYIRLNIACPRQILMEALRRMKSAIG
jgi:cystathionine beta-lyase